MLGEQLLADDAANGGADEVEARVAGLLDQCQSIGGQRSRSDIATICWPGLTGTMARQIPGQHPITRQQCR